MKRELFTVLTSALLAASCASGGGESSSPTSNESSGVPRGSAVTEIAGLAVGQCFKSADGSVYRAGVNVAVVDREKNPLQLFVGRYVDVVYPSREPDNSDHLYAVDDDELGILGTDGVQLHSSSEGITYDVVAESKVGITSDPSTTAKTVDCPTNS